MSERKFSVGDRVRILSGEDPGAHVGKIATITAGPRQIEVVPSGKIVEGYEVDLPTEFQMQADMWPLAWFQTSRLAPYYDGNERTSWSECIWQPKQVSA